MFRKYFYTFLILLTLLVINSLFLSLNVYGAEFPAYQGYVNDYAKMLSDNARLGLEQELHSYEQKTTNEIAVVTIEKLDNRSIEEYGIGLMDTWKVGKAEKDNGIIFLISKQDRKLRIEIGYGLEGILTDGDAGAIIRDVVAPQFRAGAYEEGIIDGTRSIIRGIDSPEDGISAGVENNAVRKSTGTEIDNFISNFGQFIFLIPAGFIYLASYMARTKDVKFGGLVGGIGGGVLGVVLGSLNFIVGAVLIGGIIGLILDMILSRNYQKLSQNGRRTDWFHSVGGFSGRGWGGGSSGGGFGGGSGGGGGSSGSW
ncbi:MAG: TPM domain-containing protein [bacterium]|nr:TPM domain-containing protein [bacterium]